MEQQQIIKKINYFLVEEFEVEEALIVPDANLKDTLELDSLDMVDLVVVIESNFGFKVNGEELIKLTAIKDFYDYIIQKIQNPG